MNIMKFPIRLIWRARSKTHSYFLQLPIELLLKIFEYLPPYSQLLVYRTCRPLRTIILQYFLAGKGDILATREDKVRYLTHLARSMPDRWVCAKCCKLHQTCKWDTPIYRGLYWPPECGDGLPRFDRFSECKPFFNHEYSPSHRHVELTLKYARLERQKKKHRTHLQRLLEPHHVESRRARDNDVAEGILVRRSFYPKVVNGRYLLLTVRTYLGVGTTVSRQSIRFLRICPHLVAFAAFHMPSDVQVDLDMIFCRAFSVPPNIPTFSSCVSCRTDVSMQISPERATVYAWQDLGPEATVYDPEWEAIVRETNDVYHRAGSIRELYGQHEHNSEIS